MNALPAPIATIVMTAQGMSATLAKTAPNPTSLIQLGSARSRWLMIVLSLKPTHLDVINVCMRITCWMISVIPIRFRIVSDMMKRRINVKSVMSFTMRKMASVRPTLLLDARSTAKQLINVIPVSSDTTLTMETAF
jgi:hypothetical protein